MVFTNHPQSSKSSEGSKLISEKIMSTTESILDILLMHLDEENCRHSIRDIVREITKIMAGSEVSDD